MRRGIDKTVMDEAVFSYGSLWHSIMKKTRCIRNDLPRIPDDLPLPLFVKNRQSRGSIHAKPKRIIRKSNYTVDFVDDEKSGGVEF